MKALLILSLSAFGILSVQAAGFIPVTGPCDNVADCVATNAHCPADTRLCTCNPDFISRKNLMDCLPIRHDRDQTCLEEQQCTHGSLGEFSICTPEGVCDCNSETEYLGGIKKCLPVPDLIGGDCSEDEQCAFHLGEEAICSDPDKKCICNPASSIGNDDGDFCLAFIYDFDTNCEKEEQCTLGSPGPDSRCEDTCKCNDPTVQVPVINRCLPPAAMGEECHHDIQCQATSDLGELGTCIIADGETTGVCGCKPAGIPVGARCLAIVNELDQPCEVSEQCQSGVPGPHSTCDRNLCKCLSNAVPGPDKPVPRAGNTCYLMASEVGGPCEIDEQCTPKVGVGSECVNDQCACKAPDFVESSDGKKCLALMKIDDDCEDNRQCPQNGVCRALTTCACLLEYTASSDKWRCLPVQEFLEGACVEPQQCHEGRPGVHSDCVGQKCQCNADAFNVPNFHVCHVKATQVGHPCVAPAHCEDLANTECKGNKCECLAGYRPNPGNDGCVSGIIR